MRILKPHVDTKVDEQTMLFFYVQTFLLPKDEVTEEFILLFISHPYQNISGSCTWRGCRLYSSWTLRCWGSIGWTDWWRPSFPWYYFWKGSYQVWCQPRITYLNLHVPLPSNSENMKNSQSFMLFSFTNHSVLTEMISCRD